MPERDYGLADLALKRGQVEGSRLRDLANVQAQAAQNIAQIQSRGDLARGQRMSDLVRTLALVGTKAVGDYQDQQQQQIVNRRNAELDARKMALENNQEARLNAESYDKGIAAQTVQQKNEREDRSRTIIADAYRVSRDPATGAVRRPIMEAYLTNVGMGPAVPEIFKTLDESEKANLEVKSARTKADEAELSYAKTLAQPILASGFNPAVTEGILTMAEDHGHADTVKQIRAMQSSDPAKFQQFIQQLVQGVPTQEQQDKHQEFVATLPGKIPNAQGLTPAQAATDQREQQRIGLERQRLSQSASNGGNPPKSTMSDEALNQAAEKYYSTGILPSLGIGNSAAADKRAIMDRAAEKHPGAVLAATSAAYGANKATYNTLTKQVAALDAYESTAKANLAMFLDAAAKMPDTGVPWLNTPIRQVSDKVLGNPAMSAAKASAQVALTEISRVVNNPNLTGVLSDSARTEIKSLISDDATLPQIQKAASILVQDMANRSTYMHDQKNQIGQRLGMADETAKAAAGGFPAKGTERTVGGKVYVSNGSEFVPKGGG